jgi:amino acid transporter
MNFQQLFRRKSIHKILADAQHSREQEIHGLGLKRNLTVRDLIGFGIAAIIGAGIFSTIGNAAAAGGPAVSMLFVFTAVACGFSALCYAEFASLIPISGSAYTYAYATFGELIAWIIGWDLLMEYAIGNIAVAISWSDYFTGLLAGIGYNLPAWITMDFLSAMRGFDEVQALMASGTSWASLTFSQQEAWTAWSTAPRIGTLPIVLDIPALSIVILLTWVVYVGIQESRTTSNILVALKLAVIFLVIVAGTFYIDPENWSPFAPNGINGVLKGVAAVFFAYIGFDAISTTAEECKNPERDLPRGMIWSLVICTVLYILISLVLTGMVDYRELAVGDPLAFVFAKNNLPWLSGIVAVSAVIAIAGVLLVFQMGQPRIWMSMSRDGLLPPKFSHIHPKYKTPSFATKVTGWVVAVPALFMNLNEVTELTSIGTLFAFVLVCGGILFIGNDPTLPKGRFKTPFINAKIILPVLIISGLILLHVYGPNGINPNALFFDESGQWILDQNFPLLLFILTTAVVTYYTLKKNWNLIPVLGMLSCLYLMTELGPENWIRFGLWLLLGLLIYFGYSMRFSKLNKEHAHQN